ncbi:MAG: methyl-accepting chemotaxis protein [Alkalispirochaeta sp.]
MDRWNSRMNFFARMRLAERLTAIFAMLFVVILVGIGIVAARDIRVTVEDTLDANLRSQADLVGDLVDEFSGKALELSTVFAELETVKAAYRNPDDEAGRRQLARSVDDLVAAVENASGGRAFRIHFHKPPAVSFYRTWTDTAGDDLSSFRTTILEVSRTRRPLQTVELGRGGFVIRGIAPVIDNGTYLGSVEVYYQPQEIVPFLDSEELNSGIMLLVNAEAAESLFFEEDLDQYFLGRVGESMVSVVTDEWIVPEELLKEEMITVSASDGTVATDIVGSYQLAYIPLTDFSGSVQGHLVSVFDASGFLEAAERRVLVLMIIVGALVVAAATGVYIISRRTVALPLTATADNLKQIAMGDGDLSLRMKETRNDEIGRLSRHFNNFVENLGTIVYSIQEASQLLIENAGALDENAENSRLSAESINGLMERVAQQISEQDDSISQSSASVEQITGNISSLEKMIGHLSTSIEDSAAAVEEMAANISSITRNLEQVDGYVDRLVDASERGRETVQLVTDRIAEVVDQSEHLQQANQLIASISAQTNLLAMNAAIEAAHAGEYGRGFAVVADEIRNLAENSARQSKIISGELKKTREYIGNVVTASAEAGDAFASMKEMVNTVNDLETSVRDALREQERGGESVLENLQQMRDIGGTVNGGISEISAGSTTIVSEMSKLVEISRQVTRLMEEISGGSTLIGDSTEEVQKLSRKNKELVESVAKEAARFTV